MAKDNGVTLQVKTLQANACDSTWCARASTRCARVLVLGLAFKENCPDLRNTRVVDIVQALRGYNADVDIHDP